jgi:hypothetical protein
MSWRSLRNVRARGIVGPILCIAALLFSFCFVAAKIVDPSGDGPEAALLKSWADNLDAAGVDVVMGIASTLPLSSRPRLASLRGYAPTRHDWGAFTRQAWPLAFERGVAGVMFAVQANALPTNITRKKFECDTATGEETEPCKFVNDWLSAEPDKRIFVAFTRDDFDAALAIKKSLEETGFVVFVFLKGKNEAPWADPALVGEVFAQAAHRLVIDSASARGSEGVKFESLCCEPLLLPPFKGSKWSEALTGSSPGTLN